MAYYEQSCKEGGLMCFFILIGKVCSASAAVRRRFMASSEMISYITASIAFGVLNAQAVWKNCVPNA